MLNEKTFNQAIKTISAMGEKFAETIHEAGMFAIAQVNEHGNDGFGVRLIEAMGKKHDRQRVVNWLVHFGKFGVKNGVLVYKQRRDINPENYDAILEKANNTPYWELTPEKKLVERVDYLAMLKGIVNRHKTMQKKASEGAKVEELNTGIIAEIETILAKHTTATEKAAVVGGHTGPEMFHA